MDTFLDRQLEYIKTGIIPPEVYWYPNAQRQLCIDVDDTYYCMEYYVCRARILVRYSDAQGETVAWEYIDAKTSDTQRSHSWRIEDPGAMKRVLGALTVEDAP